MKNIFNKAKKTYDKILSIVLENEEFLNFNHSDLMGQANAHLFGIELKEKYGLNVDPTEFQHNTFKKFDDYRFIGMHGKKHNRTISWSDDDRQPEDESLLCISFSTGAYIFGEDYPKELFQKFFEELLTYNPNYTDSHNHSLYFSMNNASGVFNEFEDILKKYREINRKDFLKRKLERANKEVEKLEENLANVE